MFIFGEIKKDMFIVDPSESLSQECLDFMSLFLGPIVLSTTLVHFRVLFTCWLLSLRLTSCSYYKKFQFPFVWLPHSQFKGGLQDSPAGQRSVSLCPPSNPLFCTVSRLGFGGDRSGGKRRLLTSGASEQTIQIHWGWSSETYFIFSWHLIQVIVML